MKKLIALLFLIVHFTLCIVHCSAQEIEWQKSFGGSFRDKAYCIKQTSDNGFVATGYTSSNDGDVTGNQLYDADFWIVKIDSIGALQWQKCFGGSNIETAWAIDQTTDGGFVVAGVTVSNDGDVSGNHGLNDLWIVKTDNSGNLQWQKCLGGSGYDGAYDVQQTFDGGYIIAGHTSSTDGDVTGNPGGYKAWIVKLDSASILQWEKCFGTTGNDWAKSIKQTSDGGYIIAGATGITSNAFMIVKIDSSGNQQWQSLLGGSSSDIANSVHINSDGSYIIAGSTSSNDEDVSGNHGNSDFWLVKLGTTGSLLWQKCFGGSNSDQANSIQQTSDGGYIIAGDTWSNNGDVSGNHDINDLWIIKVDSAANLQWQKCLGSTSTFESA